ncbi:MAG TPA: tetratricopeptide repeat protein [Candidatus Melainabacteria bacterium]|nr:tetratricopeptide repeat protein [Candidatus Melainabacteria bacterium]
MNKRSLTSAGLAVAVMAGFIFLDAESSMAKEESKRVPESLTLGNRALKEGNTREAIKQFNLALTDLPQNAGLRQRLANAYFREGNLQAAVEEMEAAVKLRPSEAVYQAQLAWLYTRVNRINAAMRHAKIASQLTPDAVSPWVILGYCYASLDKNELAMNALNKALALEPDNVSALTYQAEVYADMGERDKAIKNYERAILKDSGNLSVLIGLGSAYGESGKTEQEKELYEKAVKLYPRDPEALGRYGWFLSKNGDFAGAMQYGFKANSVRISRSYDQFMGMFIAVWAGLFIVFGIIFGGIAFGARFKPQPGESVIRSFFLVLHKDRPGRLVFTTRRVVFVPELVSRSIGATRLSIERDQISDTSLAVKAGSSGKLVIRTEGGAEYIFGIPVIIADPLEKLFSELGLGKEAGRDSSKADGDQSKSGSNLDAAADSTSPDGDSGSEADTVTAASYDFRPEGEEAEKAEEGKKEKSD